MLPAISRIDLLFMLFGAVGVAAVDHQRGGQLVARFGSRQQPLLASWLGALPPRKITWQSGVAMGLHHRDLAILYMHRQKWCPRCRLDGVGGDADSRRCHS
jgi:hypothetical protein